MPRKLSRAGRPSKLTQEMAAKLVKAIAAGAYLESAAAMGGISKVTLYAWMTQGARDVESGNGGTPAAEFLNAVKRAMAESEVLDLRCIGAAAKAGVWQAAAWRLERMHPEKWGRRRLAVRELGAGPEPPLASLDLVRSLAQGILSTNPTEPLAPHSEV